MARVLRRKSENGRSSFSDEAASPRYVVSERLQEENFSFCFPDLTGALADVLALH